MALTDDELDTVKRLSVKRQSNARVYSSLDDWYELRHRIDQLGLAIPPELEDFETIANWCRLSVDSVLPMLDYRGMRFPEDARALPGGDGTVTSGRRRATGPDELDEQLRHVHQANDLDTEVTLGLLDALIFGRSYACVGTNEDDEETPLVTIETPSELVEEKDPRTRRTKAVLRRYTDTEGGGAVTVQLGTLYGLGKTSHIRLAKNGRWVEDERDEHGLDMVPVVPLVNRARLGARHGVSQMVDIIPLVNAAGRALTNLQIAQETHAVPQRAVIGASKGDFIDSETGQPLSVWQAYFGAIWALTNKDAKPYQFAASDLRNFHETVKHYALLASGITNLPAAVFGFQTDNPASAEAIRGMRLQAIADAERKIKTLSGGLEDLNRVILRFVGASDGELRRAKSLEALWGDPAMQTRSERADYVYKMTQGDNPVLPVEAAWDELGFTEARKATLRRQMQEQRDAKSADPVLAGVARDLAAVTGGSGDNAAVDGSDNG